MVEEFGLVHFHKLNIQVRRRPVRVCCIGRWAHGPQAAGVWCPRAAQDKESVHQLQRMIDKVNGYIYGIADEGKASYMMNADRLDLQPPPCVRGPSVPAARPPSPASNVALASCVSGATCRNADLLVREHYDEERQRDEGA